MDNVAFQDCGPDCSGATASPGEIWPPNHKGVPISITGVTHPAGLGFTITADAVFQDEEVNAQGRGDGNTSPDASLSPLLVRSERQGRGDGRVYTVDFTATDVNGSTCEGTVNREGLRAS